MELAWGPEELAFRDELVAFIDEYAPPDALVGFDFSDLGEETVESIPQWARDWQATLFDHGWMVPAYPPELGGRNCTPVQTLVYLEELAQRRIPRSVHFPGYAIVARACSSSATTSRRSSSPPRSAATPSGASA